ncbi:PH domain-containing protein [Actinomycetospora atypica]|uniref:PH domain-containing protein n=1 Tax=Actinomycetospora atypica TaxID=1290095 RepID=A0ABV9YHT6_9PSEU
MADQQAATTAEPAPATFRAVPSVALVAVAFLALCLSPIAFQGGAWFLLFLGPLAVAAWVLLGRTRVDTAGLHVRGITGTRSLPWEQVATLRLSGKRWVHAVPEQGAELELRGVRIRDLGRVGEASGGRISAPTPAEAEAAAEHARELEAARLRIAKLKEQRGAGGEAGPDDALPDDAAAETAVGSPESADDDESAPGRRPEGRA